MKLMTAAAALVLMLAGSSPGQERFPFMDPAIPAALRADDLLARMTLAEKVAQMQYASPAIPRLGIPEYNWWNECLHGVARNGVATVFPQAIGMAATWNPPLILREAGVISTEARAKHAAALRAGVRKIYAGLTFWSPNINIFRDPRWGRGQETYGEDPFLTSRIGVAFIRGLQGDDPGYARVIATPKHFAVHSGPEPSRHSFDARTSRRDLYETYLPAFEAAVTEAKAGSIMGAYNRYMGSPCCASDLLLGEILRKEWKFDGYVVSDCGAIYDIVNGHRVAATPAAAAAMAVKAGCDLTCGTEYGALTEAVEKRLITEKEIDVSLRRLLFARLRLGLFDPPAMVPPASIGPEQNDTPDHDALALEVARESIVLLKNEGKSLPFPAETGTIAVVGPNAFDVDVLLGNYNGTPSHPVTLLEGIRRGAGSARILYARGCDYAEGKDTAGKTGDPADEAVALAQQADRVVAVLGLSPALEGEEMNVSLPGFSGGDRTDIALPAMQERLLERLVATGRPVTLVLLNGSALAIPWAKEHVPAIIEAWYPGQRGGDAVADVLFGRYNPAGRLPVTFYRSVEDLPPFEEYAMAGRTYRFFGGEVLFPFGHGLSYTSFRYGSLRVPPSWKNSDDTLRLSVPVRNTGDRAGDEVVQAYVRNVSAAGKGEPIRSLKAFRRVHLAPGEEQAVSLPIARSAMRIFDEKRGTYAVAPGIYEVEVGASSADIRGKARFTIPRR